MKRIFFQIIFTVSFVLAISACKNVSTIVQEPTTTFVPTGTPYPTETPIPTKTIEPTFTNTPTLGVGSERIREIDGMSQVFVPAGEFQMGYNDEQFEKVFEACLQRSNGRCDREIFGMGKHLHTVYLDGFWIDKTEVTNSMFKECVNNGKCEEPDHEMILAFLESSDNPMPEYYYQDEEYGNFPVTFISWNQASNYCHWVGGELSTEAQWEKAARGFDGKIYPWGNQEPNNSLANYGSVFGDLVKVGNFPDGKSDYGALDMFGNVEEWVYDWNWYDSGSLGTSLDYNPTGPEEGERKMLRGGDWTTDDYLSNYASSTHLLSPSSVFGAFGIRCVNSN